MRQKDVVAYGKAEREKRKKSGATYRSSGISRISVRGGAGRKGRSRPGGGCGRGMYGSFCMYLVYEASRAPCSSSFAINIIILHWTKSWVYYV